MTLKLLTFLIIIINNVYGKQVRIIGGTDAAAGEFPYHAVLRRISDYGLICGGAIITPYHILTAAHCVHEQIIVQNNFMISLGSQNLMYPFTSNHLPEKIHIHPLFKEDSGGVLPPDNDIAVVQTRDQIYFDQNKTLIGLPTSDIINGDSAVLSGWGIMTFPEITLPQKLQKVNVTVSIRSICNENVPFFIYRDQFCGYLRQGISACIGDGGSPLVKDGQIIGIYSICHLYAYGVPNIFTNVHTHLTFIRMAIAM